MEKKVMIAALFLAMFVLSSNIKLVESGPEDCIDACYTGCVFPNDGKALRECENKCDIRCGKGGKAAENQD
uniref:Thionin-like protein n=1 Tax=Daucus carota subsp. sativus TaxID=79200 RepID=A0A175YE87_DAUCS